jgi:two-component system heavy metal sensor histidine kinase CusS
MWITAESRAATTALTIRNTGSRIAPEDAAKLFDRFWRGDEARSATGTHCGLGLSLCRKIIDLLGGTLTADLREGMFTATASFPTPGEGS